MLDLANPKTDVNNLFRQFIRWRTHPRCTHLRKSKIWNDKSLFDTIWVADFISLGGKFPAISEAVLLVMAWYECGLIERISETSIKDDFAFWRIKNASKSSPCPQGSKTAKNKGV